MYFYILLDYNDSWVRTKYGVILGSDRRASKGFFIGSKITQKITRMDDTLAVAVAGQTVRRRTHHQSC